MADEQERWCPICGNHTTLVIAGATLWCSGKGTKQHKLVRMVGAKPKDEHV